jgi:hypothetical protein
VVRGPTVVTGAEGVGRVGEGGVGECDVKEAEENYKDGDAYCGLWGC